jgi:hypothetical protein
MTWTHATGAVEIGKENRENGSLSEPSRNTEVCIHRGIIGGHFELAPAAASSPGRGYFNPVLMVDT